MNKKLSYILPALLTLLSLLGLAACSDEAPRDRHMMDGLHQHEDADSVEAGESHADSDDHATSHDHSSHEAHGDHHGATHETKPADARSVRIVASDFAFEPATIDAKPGEKLYVKLINQGDAVHMWQIEDRMETHVHTNAGETSTKVVTAPSEPGVYQIICTTPGHEKLGMVGTLRVQ